MEEILLIQIKGIDNLLLVKPYHFLFSMKRNVRFFSGDGCLFSILKYMLMKRKTEVQGEMEAYTDALQLGYGKL